jgi:hypothetical protein
MVLRLHPIVPAGEGWLVAPLSCQKRWDLQSLTGLLSSQFSGSIRNNEFFGTRYRGSASEECFPLHGVRDAFKAVSLCLRPEWASYMQVHGWPSNWYTGPREPFLLVYGFLS